MGTKTEVLILLVVTSAKIVLGQFNCPEPDEIWPCTCIPKGTVGNLICSGPNVTQDSIDNLFALTRSANNLSSSEGLDLSTFEMEDTDLTSLNLTPFAKCRMEAFYLTNNHQIVQVIGATNSTEEEEVVQFQFSSGWVSMDFSQLNDKEVATLLKFVIPESVNILSFVANKIEGSSVTGEIIEGLSKCTNLERLFLNQNQIIKVARGQFRFNTKLDALFLFGNQINHIGEDAFLLDSNPDMKDVTFEIWLDSNLLNNDRIQPTHGLQGNSRPMVFLASSNQFDFISSENFEALLLADSRNELYLQNNQWICDDRMKWLKAGRELYEHRVFGMECQNDPGFTVFTTSLISVD